MKFEVSTNSLDQISSDAAIVFALQAEGDKKKTQKYVPLSSFVELDKILNGQLAKAMQLEQFTGKRGEVVSIIPATPVVPSRVFVIGLGKKDGFVADDLRRAVGSFAKKMKRKIDSISFTLPKGNEVALTPEDATYTIAEGLLLGGYDFSKYKSKGTEDHVLTVGIVSAASEVVKRSAEKGIKKAELYAQATILARDLVNEEAATATPSYLAQLAKDIAKAHPEIVCKVYGREQVEKMGMHAFLGVARAADTEPQFIHLTYLPAGRQVHHKRKLAIVGKGITFDSGGINVKPGDHMQDMKMDMSGAAAVLGVFSVIVRIKPDFPVTGLIAATPNLISGKSIVPGDIVKALNGKTIEILNTDAEGRVTMADSLSYAVKEKATEIIDLATLTGACVVALGTDVAGLMSNNRELAERVKAAAFDAGEKVWELPLEKDYKTMNKSEVADIANIPNSRYGGTITAGLFLEEFVDNTPWVHVDIAGPAFVERDSDIGPKGGSGFGVRTLLNLLVEN